jgi:hypothetical protein
MTNCSGYGGSKLLECCSATEWKGEGISNSLDAMLVTHFLLPFWYKSYALRSPKLRTDQGPFSSDNPGSLRCQAYTHEFQLLVGAGQQFMFSMILLLSIHERFLFCGIVALTRKNAMHAVHHSGRYQALKMTPPNRHYQPSNLCGGDRLADTDTTLPGGKVLLTDNGLRLLNGLLSLSEDELDVAGVGHIGVDTTVGAVCAAALLGGLVDLDVLDDQVASVETLGIGVGLGVLEETEEELGGLDGPAGTGDTELLALRGPANAAAVASHGDGLLLLKDVLEELLGAGELPAVDGLGGLAGVLEGNTEVGAARAGGLRRGDLLGSVPNLKSCKIPRSARDSMCCGMRDRERFSILANAVLCPK